MIPIDQQGHLTIIEDATQYLTYLINQLGNSYDVLSTQKVDINDLANALDSMIFANDKLKQQKVKLESYRKELQSNISSPDAVIKTKLTSHKEY